MVFPGKCGESGDIVGAHGAKVAGDPLRCPISIEVAQAKVERS